MKRFITSAISLLAVITSIGFLWRNNLALTIAMTVVGTGLLMHDKFKYLKLYALCVGLGVLAETLLVNVVGVWQYTNPGFIGFPTWVPLVWGAVGLLVMLFAQAPSHPK